MKEKDFYQQVAKGLKKLDINYEQEQITSLWQYLNFLLEENKKYNLTGAKSPEEIMIKHFFDSLVLLKEIKIQENMIDIGTGAGFPGMVLKVFRPNLRVVLVDSLEKRCNFLKLLKRKLDLAQVEIIKMRAEKIGKKEDYREQFQLVVSRAVASLNTLVEYTLPLAKIGGITVLYKGPNYQEELSKSREAIRLLGGKLLEVKKVQVPELKESRYLIFLEKIRETASKFPRRIGIPKKRPL